MDHVRIGRVYRALRLRLRWRQSDLAARSRTSQSVVSRVELGQIDGVTVATLVGLANALGARLDIRLAWQGEAADRLLDSAHAAVVERVIRRLERHAWAALPEATFNVFGERGSIDVLARHPGRRNPLVIEVKTAIGDVQELIATHDRKARLAPRIAVSGVGGVRTGPADRLLVVVGSRTARRRVAEHAATFLAAYPCRGASARLWLDEPPPDGAPFAGLIFVAPTRGAGRRQRVRIRRRVDGLVPRSATHAHASDDRLERGYHPPRG